MRRHARATFDAARRAAACAALVAGVAAFGGCVELSRSEKLTTHRIGMTGTHLTPGTPGGTLRVLPTGAVSRLVPPDLPGVWSHDVPTVEAAKRGAALPRMTPRP